MNGRKRRDSGRKGYEQDAPRAAVETSRALKGAILLDAGDLAGIKPVALAHGWTVSVDKPATLADLFEGCGDGNTASRR